MITDLTYAELYFNSRLHVESWDNATATDRVKALQTSSDAVELLDLIITRDADGHLVDPPDLIKNAVCENALYLLMGVDPEEEYNSLRVKQESYTKTSATYDTNIANFHTLLGLASATALRRILPYLRDNNTVNLARVS